MGKEGDLWDDSALIEAFDTAVSKYKVMHGIGSSNKGKTADDNAEECLPAAEANTESKVSGSNTENVQIDGTNCAVLETTSRIRETEKLLKFKENPLLNLASSTNHVGTSNSQTDNPLASENPAMEFGLRGKHTLPFDAKSQNEAAWYSNGHEEYNQLLNKYYEIEDQRQRVLQQLNQYNNWYHQNPEQHQASVPQHYNTVTCNCSYGCQSWVVPCNSSPTSCLGDPCTDKSCHVMSKDDQKGNSMPRQDPDFVQTAMLAAKTALSSLTQDASSNANASANEVKDKESGTEVGDLSKSSDPAADLAVVLNAWYSAGFYTGKYLSEQSLEKKKRG